MNKNFKGAKIDIYSENTSPQQKKNAMRFAF